MKNYRTAGVVLSVLFMALFLGALGLRIWASDRSTDILGPNHLAVGLGRVYADVNGELFVLSSRGGILTRKPLQALVHDTSLIDLRVMRNGRLLLATHQPAGVELCDPLRWQCAPVGRETTQKISAQIKVLADEVSGRLYISDAGGDQVWVQPLAGGVPRPVAAKRTFSSPNDIAMDDAGGLWVADSGHRRIVALDLKGDGTARRVTRSFAADNGLAMTAHDWPMMMAMGSDGNWWVTQPTDIGNSADLLVYRPDKGAVSRVRLPEGAEPADVVRLGTTMLVSDMINFKIYQIDTASHAVGEFGDASFRAAIRPAAVAKARYRALVEQSLIGMIAAGVLMLLAAYWASPQDKRWLSARRHPGIKPIRISASGTPMPPLKETHWLRPAPALERILRRETPMSNIMFFTVLAMMAGVSFNVVNLVEDSGIPSDKMNMLVWYMIFLAAFFVAVIVMQRSTAVNRQLRLGTDGHQLYVRLPDGRHLTVPPERLVYGATEIAYQRYVFPIQIGVTRFLTGPRFQPLYDEGEVETYIVPLLGRAKRLGPWQLFRYQLGYRQPVSVAILALAVISAVTLFGTGMWRQILVQWGLSF